jgi:3-methyladenine DNA glycosylase AlkD
LLRHADDDRNFVKKAINWTLRQLGKRNLALNAQAIQTAQAMLTQTHKSAHWIANDALRELTNPTIQARLRSKAHE